MWVARIKRSDSGSLIIDLWSPARNSWYSRAMSGETTSIISWFSTKLDDVEERLAAKGLGAPALACADPRDLLRLQRCG